MQAHAYLQRWMITSFIVSTLMLPAWGKGWPLAIPKGGQVVLKVPTVFWQVAKYDSVSAGGQNIYFVDVADVLQKSDWETLGFPYCGEFNLTKILEFRPVGKLRYTEVELRNASIYVKLRFSADVHDINAEFQRAAVGGTWQQFESSEDFHRNIFNAQGGRIFTGPLAGLTDPLKLALLHMVCRGQNSFATETYKGKNYFAVTLGGDGIVYNSIKLNASARASTVINDRLLNTVKTFRGVAQEAGIDGVKLVTRIPYRDFLSEVVPHYDDLEVYLPLDLCSKFADADITSQQLIDGGIVILNGNRIQVPLSGNN